MITTIFALGTAFIAFAITAITTKYLIPILARMRAGQCILEIGPNWHKSKEGTPTMGGIAFLFCALVLIIPLALLLYKREIKEDVLSLALVLVFAIGNGAIGIIDDLTKLVRKENKGLTPLQKLALQGTLAAAFVFLLAALHNFTTVIPLPFVGITVNLGLFYYPFLFLFLLWFVNCTNLTDGIDGLASSIAGIIGLFFTLAGLLLSQSAVAYPGAILTGCGFGFLLFNHHPAKIFMGDTGSLFLGALIVATACVMGNPLLLLLFGFLFVWEGISVCLQVIYFKLSHGKRLFKMAPFHHHMEKSGWRENEIVLLFSLLTILLSLLALMGVRV